MGSKAFERYQKGDPGFMDCELFGASSNPLSPQRQDFQGKARQFVFEYVQNKLPRNESAADNFALDDVFVVWFCKVLQNWKALVSTTLPDGMYYEVTHNGDKAETYIDAYKKFDNVCVPDKE